MLLALGDYRFSLSTAAYRELRRETAWRWESQPRLGRPPAWQFLGRGEDVVRLNGVIYPHFRGGLGQVEAMRMAADRAEPLLLVAGDGTVMGRWVVRRIAETQAETWADGRPKRQSFELELAAYGDDAAEDAGGGAA